VKIAVIGGGAAGFFAAIQVKTNFPNATVHLLEKSNKVLAKVRISGGGRCNVTNQETSIKLLSKAYPRGEKFMKNLLQEFSTEHIQKWFNQRGVPLKTESDGRVFPVSNSSQSIIDCLFKEVEKLDITFCTKTKVTKIEASNNAIQLTCNGEIESFNYAIIATGGSPKISGLDWLSELGHTIANPVPSLFTFNVPNNSITSLMGLSVNKATVSIQGQKLKSNGPLLITHWGFSGPAILKLSAFGARSLEELKYAFTVQISWINETNENIVTDAVNKAIQSSPKKKIGNNNIFKLPQRLWEHLLAKSEIPGDKIGLELGKKAINKLAKSLSNDSYPVEGKTTFKEEFVTCGGIDLSSINKQTLESKVCNNLFFAGEILDVDGITGGYNFQAAWTTGYVAAKLGKL